MQLKFKNLENRQLFESKQIVFNAVDTKERDYGIDKVININIGNNWYAQK